MRRLSRQALFVVLVLSFGILALLLIDACSIVDGLVVAEPGEASSSEAGADASADPCAHTLPPARAPREPSEPPGDELMVVVATNIGFGVTADGGREQLSFDLDGVCTCAFQQPDSCKPNGGAPQRCDDVGGADNAAQAIFAEARSANLSFEKDTNESVTGGRRAVLIRVQGYNGQANDSEVRVGVLVSPGLFDGSGKNVAPTLTKSDQWAIDDKSADERDGVIIPRFTFAGYVVANELVVDALQISVPVSEVSTITLADAKLVATIEPAPGGGHTLGEARFAGRWSIAEATRVVGSVERSNGTGRLCEATAQSSFADYSLFQVLKARVCEAADLRANPAEDGRGQSCNAISVAVGIRGAPASLGKLRPVDSTGFCAQVVNDCTKDGG